ncbi:MAG: hypothetical protein NC217_03315 [Muribaculaceae bacterium]|nr:hypothetical protein [Muribaculaceae bacterium]
MKKIGYISSLAVIAMLSSCGDTQIEHCTNEYDPVEKGNVDSLSAKKAEVVSEIPEAGEAEKALNEAKNEQSMATDSIGNSIGTEYDEEGNVITPETGGEISLSEQAQLEEIGEVANKNRRTSEEAQREQAERQRKALEEMNN